MVDLGPTLHPSEKIGRGFEILALCLYEALTTGDTGLPRSNRLGSVVFGESKIVWSSCYVTILRPISRVAE